MFESIRNIFQKKQEIVEKNKLNLESLPDWLNEKEEACTNRRNEIYSQSRQVLLKLENELKELLAEFKEGSESEPQHHKVEQVNRHALPQFIKKIEAELKTEFSDDDEEFYKEIAGLISGCFAAYRGPGRYLHILYPEEVKAFRMTLDEMGKELNRMTDVMKISRERLISIYNVRDTLIEREDLLEEFNQYEAEERSIDAGYSDGEKRLEALKKRLADFEKSEEFRLYEEINIAFKEAEKRHSEKSGALEGSIRTAVPVWKRAERLLAEKKHSDDEKLILGLINVTTSHHKDNEELSELVRKTSGIIFSFISEGSLEVKNSFEKALFSTEEQYIERLVGLINASVSSNKEKTVLKEEIEKSAVSKKREKILHDIREEEHELSSMKEERVKINERRVNVKEKIRANLKALSEKFADIKDEKNILDLRDVEDGREEVQSPASN